jgi:hypothetical protein
MCWPCSFIYLECGYSRPFLDLIFQNDILEPFSIMGASWESFAGAGV